MAEEYDKKNKPVIITDVVTRWPAYEKWSKEGLLQRFGNSTFKTDEVDFDCREKISMTMKDYFAYSQQTRDEDPIYLFDDKFNEREDVKELLDDYTVPVYFQEDYLTYLEEERPPFRWIVIGPPRSGSPFHVDPYRTAAWNALLRGRKRWLLYPYDQFPPGCDVELYEDNTFEFDSPEPIKWFLETYPRLEEHQKPIECFLEEGEVIFIPSGWWHMVLNLTETIAVTQNFCNAQNFPAVCAEVEFDDEDFWEDFQERITKARPDIQWPSTKGLGPFKV